MPEWPRRISEEMRQHLDDEYDALRTSGVTHEDAMRRLAGDVDELASMRAPWSDDEDGVEIASEEAKAMKSPG